MKKVLSAALAGALIATALAAPVVAGTKPKKGRKAIGTVVSFDAATGQLVAEMRNGATFTGQVSPEARVKLEHRGKPAQKGNATKGSLEDLVAGAKLLKLKRSSGVIVRLHLRPAGSTVVDHPGKGGECKSGDDDDAADTEAETESSETESSESESESSEGDSETSEDDEVTAAEADPEDCIRGDGNSGDSDSDDSAETESDNSDDSVENDSDDDSGSEDE